MSMLYGAIEKIKDKADPGFVKELKTGTLSVNA